MSDDEDLELQALQRQLDDAFETTRPRPAFEDELWSRMQARRPVGSRIADLLRGLFDSVLEAPGVPAVAVAVLLIVAVGVGIVSLSGNHFGGAGSTASLATRPESGGAQYAAGQAAFGKLPAPALGSVPVGDTGPPKTTNPDGGYPAAANLYLGPAKLIWAGQLNEQITSAPVFRYLEPTSQDADTFATALGASTTNRAGGLGQYSGNGFVLGIVGSSRQPLGEPVYYLTPDRSRLPAPGPTPVDTATALLTAHSLMPTWPYVVAVEQFPDFQVVEFLRQFSMPGYGNAYLVNSIGVRYGLKVEIKDGQPLQAYGPLPLNLDTADYPIVSANRAVSMALASSPSGPASIQPEPTVRLTNAELVYALVNAGDHSFYEPAFLFSGTFTQSGVTYTKRVLVPAVDPSLRSS